MKYELETKYNFGLDLLNKLRGELGEFNGSRIIVSMSGKKDNGATLTRVCNFSRYEEINPTMIHGYYSEGGDVGGDVFTISRNGDNSLILDCDDKDLVRKIKSSV